jgi:hypothetical protein
MITFLAGRETVAGFHVIWPVQDPLRDEKIIAELELRRLGTIIYSLSQYAHIGNFRDNAPRLFDYLAHHYEIAEVFSRQPFGQLLTALRRVTPGPWLGARLDLAASDAVTRRLWPFAEVLASRVGTAESRLVARVTTTIPPGRPRLAFRYGVNPERWLEQTSGPFTFLVEVEDQARGGPAPLYSAEIDPARRLRDRRWQQESLDLSSWAGREVTLAFSVTAPREPKQPTDIAGWAAPRILGD